MERKSFVQEIHKVVQKDLSELYNSLSKKLGPDNPFAKVSIGNGYYLWADNRCQWRQMISTCDLERGIIQDALLKTKMNVASIIGNTTADVLFTTPDDSYIYYNDDKGDVKILITGWGFKKPVRIIGGPDDGELRKKRPITLSFSYDGDKLPMYEFGVQIPSQVKKLKTDVTGHYHFSNLTQDELLLKDFATGKDFRLVVEEGRTEYDFDVTIYTKLLLKATEGNSPVIGEPIQVQYYGKNYNVSTGAAGTAVVQLPLHDNEQVIATLRNQSQSATIQPDDNCIEFVFESPAAEFTTNIEVSVMEDSKPVSGKSITITYAGKQYLGTTNEQGLFTQQVDVATGESCVVTVANYEPQSKVLQESSSNVFRFEKTNAPVIPPVQPTLFAPHILIEGDNGFIGSKYPITVEYNEVTTDYISDDNGIVQLHEMEVGKTMKVTDGLNPTNIAEYELKEEQLEYVFHVPYEKKEENVQIKVMLRDAAGKPIKCDRVRFMQESVNDVLATLDNNGDTHFAIDTFLAEKPISVSIQGAAKNYDAFTFALDKDETEYLLQEKNTTSWLSTLGQILLVMASMAALSIFWPFFVGICAGTFMQIYQ